MKLTQFAKGIGRLAGTVVVAMISSHGAFAQSVSIDVTTTKQQTFQGFGAEISDTLNTFLPRGGRVDRTNSTARSLYDLLLKSNDANSLNLSFLRLDLPNDVLQRASGAAYYDFPTAIVKTGEADIIKAAKSRNPRLKLCYVPGTPPFWMKENGANYNVNATVTFSSDAQTTNHLLASQQANYAALLGKFCTSFNNYFGYPFDVLSLQNEPDVNANYNSCVFPSNSSVDPNAATYTSMLTVLRKVPPFSSWSLPQLWGTDSGNAKNPDYIGAAANLGQLNAVCLHDYGSFISNLPDYDRNNLPVALTEYSLGADNYLINNTPNQPWMAATMADGFCRDANEGHVASWFWFRSIARSTSNTGECLIAVNMVNNPKSTYKYIDTSGYPVDHALVALNDNTKYPTNGGPYTTSPNSDFTGWTLTSKYYVFRRLTQSIQPGSVSMKTTLSPTYNSFPYQDDVYSAAFQLPNGKYCIVIANQSSKQYTVNLKVDGLTSSPYTGLTAYYTAQGDNDVSWTDQLTNGAITTTAWPYSVLCYVQK
jgi:O-glycosyl hydrolase